MNKQEMILEFIQLKLDDFADKAIEAKQLSDQKIVKNALDQLTSDIFKTQNALEGDSDE